MANRLTAEALWDILTTPLDVPIATIAAKWGVSEQTVRMTKRAETAKARGMVSFIGEQGGVAYILPPADPDEHRGRLSDDQVREIRSQRGVSSKALAKKMGCSPAMIRMVRTRQAYNHVGE